MFVHQYTLMGTALISMLSFFVMDIAVLESLDRFLEVEMFTGCVFDVFPRSSFKCMRRVPMLLDEIRANTPSTKAASSKVRLFGILLGLLGEQYWFEFLVFDCNELLKCLWKYLGNGFPSFVEHDDLCKLSWSRTTF